MMDKASTSTESLEKRLDHSRPISRRFTTLEGWRQTRYSLQVVAGSTISSLIPDPAYDPEWQIHEDGPAQSRLSRSSEGSGFTFTGPTYGQGSGHDSWSSTHHYQHWPPVGPFGTQDENPFADDNSIEAEEEKRPPSLTRSEKPFHVFTKRQKWAAIAIIGVAGLFSGLSSNIYFPALDSISQDLGVSLSAVSLTITSYLIIQGISPLIWGSLSDTLGRRPIYIYSFSVYIVANVVLSFSPNFAVLLIFRGLQAAGSASTVSIGNGVIQDIALPVERGAFISFYQAIRNFSIAVGPVLGGILDSFFGFRSIFIFLLIASSLTLVALVIFLPETLRTIAGDGSVKLSGIHRPLIQRCRKEPAYMQDPGSTPRVPVTVGTFLKPLKLLVEKDILVSLVFGGVVYAVWSMVVASTTGLFKDRFKLSELLLGLAFLPNGAGTIVGSAMAGKLMTREFLRAEEVYVKTHPEAASPSMNKRSLAPDFPIEHARLRHVPWITTLFVVTTAIYGFTLLPADQVPLVSQPGWIAVPLLLQFIIASTSNAIFAINTALVADLCPGQGASATAINNLVRCSIGAVGVALVDAMLVAFGPAATFLGLGLLSASMGVLLAAEWSWGMQWRSERERAKASLSN